MQNAYLSQPIATITGVSYATVATANVVGGGGGFSVVEPEPSSQKLVSGTSDYQGGQYLTPTDYQSDPSGSNFVEPTSWSVTSTRPVVSGGGSGRAEPDVSADADPYSGYLLYEPSFAGVGQATLQGCWGGTSFVAPQFNGSTAVIDSYLGHRIGLWNPSVYSFAASGDSPVTPLNQVGTGNDNIFYTGEPRPALQRGDRPRRPEPGQVGRRPRPLAVKSWTVPFHRGTGRFSFIPNEPG